MSKKFEEMVPVLKKELENLYPGGKWEDEKYILDASRFRNEEIPPHAVDSILRSHDPEKALEDYLHNCDFGLHRRIRACNLQTVLPESRLYKREIDRWLAEHVRFICPKEYFLSKRYKINLMLLTWGEADRGYKDCGCYARDDNGKDFHEDCALAVLAEKQGCKDELMQMVKNGDCVVPRAFVQSVAREMIDYDGFCFRGEVTVLANLCLGDIIRLQIRKRAGEGEFRISQNAMIGIFDPVTCEGGRFEIRLERDITLPVSLIWDLWPEYAEYYCFDVRDMLGTMDSAWVKDAVTLA